MMEEVKNTDKTNGSGAKLDIQQSTDESADKASKAEVVKKPENAEALPPAGTEDDAAAKKKSSPELVSKEEQLDEEEKEYRALRRDIPGVKGASEAGTLTIGVGKQPAPKNTFYRTHKTFRPVVAMVNIEVGMDKHFYAVMPNMIEPLASIGITVANYTLYLTVTPDGGLRIIPVRGPNEEGVQNEWDRTKEMALIEAVDGWYRMYTDKANNAYKNFPAPANRYGEPKWPEIKPAKIIKMAFRDKGRLIDSTDHILVQKWAGRDRS
jgi:hypothetical protein